MGKHVTASAGHATGSAVIETHSANGSPVPALKDRVERLEAKVAKERIALAGAEAALNEARRELAEVLPN